jgi:hypothetical protein
LVKAFRDRHANPMLVVVTLDLAAEVVSMAHGGGSPSWKKPPALARATPIQRLF